MKKPYAIIIMDGYGLAPAGDGNAISIDGSKNVNYYRENYPSATLGASGRSVGLPDGQMGNSEVGHLNMGAGRIVYQDLTKITKEIEDGEFFQNPALLKAMENAKQNGKKLHLWGLLSDGGVHSHITHLYALLEMAKRHGVPETYVHGFMDGRDVSPTSGVHYVEQLQAKMDELGYGKIASLSGRYYAMDRDNNWDRIEKAYDMLTIGTGIHETNAAEALKKSYENGVTDEFVLPTNIVENGKPVALVGEGDSVIFFNFRPDRAREITRAFSQDPFVVPKGTAFERKTGFLHPVYVCFTVYDAAYTNVEIAFPKQSMHNTLGEYLAKMGKKTAPHCGDGEVRARHVLLQRRRGSAQRKRGARPHQFAQGRNVRLETRNERVRGDGQSARRAFDGYVRRDDPQLCQLRHGRTYGRDPRRSQGGARGGRVREEGRRQDPFDGRQRASHRRPRQRGQAPRYRRFALHGAHHQPRARGAHLRRREVPERDAEKGRHPRRSRAYASGSDGTAHP